MSDEKNENGGFTPQQVPSYDEQPMPQPLVNKSDKPLEHSTSQKSFDPSIRLEVPSDQDAKVFQLAYSVNDTPSWYLTIVLAFQHYLIMFGATLSVPLILAPALCVGENNHIKAQLISTIFFCSGLATLLQSTIGTRLPIIQGASFAFLAPTFAILSLEKWKCPENLSAANETAYWEPRLCEIQGAIIGASIFEFFVGFTGLAGLLLRYIGPITIAPTIGMAGLSLFSVSTAFASKYWYISGLTVFLITIFSQYCNKIKLPFISYNRTSGFRRTSFPLFRILPVILAILISWVVCAILTKTDVFQLNGRGHNARTDLRWSVISKSDWFRVPYPGQWGLPTFSVGAIFGMLSGILASIMESIGDYYACARISGAKPPPVHALNRGICMEGLGCIVAGLFGSGNATTSYSENIGAIGITKVGSRRVIQVGAVIMLIFGVFGKLGALFVTIPDPIVGGSFIVMFGMITAVGISNLQFVDMNSARNLYIIGFSFLIGLALPKYMEANPGLIDTGSTIADQMLTVLLSTSMFVGGMSGFVLDNTMPGTDEERGLVAWRSKIQKNSDTGEELIDECYELPFVSTWIRKQWWSAYVPILPGYKGISFLFSKKTKLEAPQSNNETVPQYNNTKL